MFRRKDYNFLVEWKAKKEKKALCIIGARQIGKTTLIRKFGQENYKNFVEINFLTDKNIHKIFSESIDANTILTNLSAYVQKPMETGQTLVFLDEIQECPAARTAIKFLVEDGRFDYIESGSMLGVKYNEVPSYPVGFEHIHYMYSMTFLEFAMANGVQQETIDYLENSFNTKSPVTNSVHEVFINLFKAYIVVGGMPQVVQTFVDTHDIGKVVNNQREILELYRMDIAKYSKGADKIKIKAIFDSIAAQLNEKNRRFFLSSVDQNGKINRYEDSFQWLAEAGVALPCYNVEAPQLPLELNAKRNLFKLFMGDTGLLCASCMENVQFDILQGNLDVNLGSILENVIAQTIKSNGFKLYYFDSKKLGEVDFIVQNGMKVDVLEVKSGKDYKRHNALNKILSVEEWHFDKKIVFCKDNIQTEGNISYFPWYMASFYKGEKIPNIKVKLDLSGLQNGGIK